ncbi:putative phosphatidate phosphatase [Hyposmocoma kahamanoa]|uniref:putative phosphatidate phosphatase n=1 Tax=Hyposmocoma kahamanoa TaxID=1477025 RepID=UPI000E6D827B|nr:putative phosphatidate phosphatase [Hyposmocoma kahamanoa]
MGVNKLILKIVLDFFVICALGFILLSVWLWVEPYHRGYFQDDYSIRLPYKDEAISAGLLAGLGFALNIITVIIIEVIRYRRGKSAEEKYVCGTFIPGWIWESYVTIGIFTFGAACQQLTCNLAKNVIGRLRPHFFDVCRPVPTNSELNLLGYIVDYTCNGTSDASKLKDMRLSFPSAHSSFAMYSAIFFILYIQTKGKWSGSKLIRHVLQFAVLMAAWYVGLSRVVDHMHHWGDVAAGFAVGSGFAFVVFTFVLKPKKYGLPTSWEDRDAELAGLPR